MSDGTGQLNWLQQLRCVFQIRCRGSYTVRMMLRIVTPLVAHSININCLMNNHICHDSTSPEHWANTEPAEPSAGDVSHMFSAS